MRMRWRSNFAPGASARPWRHICPILCLTLLSSAAAAEPPLPPIDFDHDVRPILAQHCLECHGPDKPKAGLRLTDRDSATSELRSGERAIVPGDLPASALMHRISTPDPDERMPPKGEPLSPEQIETLRRWIREGAAWRSHWAYRPVIRPDPPAVRDQSWVRHPIDRFILARLEARAIPPSPEADRYTLIKRLYYDLLGLAPAIADVDAFVNDPSPAAYERLVDRLLQSPHLGERWGRHWLDKARYADSDGYEKDGPRPDAWKYRDWVIDAINRDLPFDRFTLEQLAGDLMPQPSTSQIIATAFHRQTLTNLEGGVDQEQFRVEALFDRVETTGAVWLGLTIGCARCHNHKYDDITQKEYYQLFAFFNNAEEVAIELPISEEAMAQHRREMHRHEQRLAELQAKLVEAEPGAAAASGGDADDTGRKAVEDLRMQIEELKKTAPRPPVIAVRVVGQRAVDPRPTHILARGDFLRPEQPVTPGGLAILPPIGTAPGSPSSAQPLSRLDLARWLVDDANPLTPRIAVNQIWSHLFGHGLVRTANDFGVRGEKPSHPELLDWLADEFRRLAWSRKALIRTIVISSGYRQSSRHRPELLEIDPENRLLHRQNRFRVEGEIVRDLALCASGLLSRRIGGPSVFPPMPQDVAALSYANNFRWKTSEGDDRYRRGMYTFFKRTAPHPNLMTFDCPDANATLIQRPISNTPIQALVLLNNETFVEAAQAFARRILALDLPSDAERLACALRLCIARPPSTDELNRFQSLLDECRHWYSRHPDHAARLVSLHRVDGVPIAEAAAWAATARIMLNLDEFLTRE